MQTKNFRVVIKITEIPEDLHTNLNDFGWDPREIFLSHEKLIIGSLCKKETITNFFTKYYPNLKIKIKEVKNV